MRTWVRLKVLDFISALDHFVSLHRYDADSISEQTMMRTLAKIEGEEVETWRGIVRSACPDLVSEFDRAIGETARAILAMATARRVEAQRVAKEAVKRAHELEWRLLEQECAVIEAQQAAEERAEVARRQAEEAERAEEEAMISDMFSEVKILRIRPA